MTWMDSLAPSAPAGTLPSPPSGELRARIDPGAGLPSLRRPGISTDPVWEDGAWTALPALVGVHRAEVCVVGLGAGGIACLGELAAAGVSAIGVDALAVGAGASGREGGMLLGGLAPFHHDAVARFGRARATRLYRATLGEIARLVRTHPDLVRPTGSLRIATDAHELSDCQHQYDAMRLDELPVAPYEGPEGGGLLFPGDAAFQPLALCRREARLALAAGARLFESSAAQQIEPGRVRLAHGEVRCREVIVCVDGGLDRLLPELAGRVRSARLQMLATAPVEQRLLERPVQTRYGHDYWQQLPDGRIALGGARDRAGDAEWTEVQDTSTEIQVALERLLRERLQVRVPVARRWAATVAYSRSGLPILERTASGAIACGAFDGTGSVLGRLCGRAAARIALGRPEPLLDLLQNAR